MSIFREMASAIHDDGPPLVFERALAPRLLEARRAFQEMEPVFDGDSSQVLDSALTEQSWTLYAFSRVVDTLVSILLDDDDQPPRVITQRELETFFLELECTRAWRPRFHPFFHEIVRVTQADDPTQVPVVISELWPAWMRRSLLLTRAGVHVYAGADHLVKTIAERSTLYFCSYRFGREVLDLSHGWGHNSQWRTVFRRDYLVDGTLFFNAGAKQPKAPHPDQDLTAAARLELLRHRCFVTVDAPSADRWPFDDRHEEPDV